MQGREWQQRREEIRTVEFAVGETWRAASAGDDEEEARRAASAAEARRREEALAVAERTSTADTAMGVEPDWPASEPSAAGQLRWAAWSNLAGP